MSAAAKQSTHAMSDEEERDLAASVENEAWASVGDIEDRRTFWRDAARNTLDGKRRRISILIPERDLARLKTRAAEEGLPYQTLINSIIHKYVES